MRVIAGQAKGRYIKVPGVGVRPATELVRGAIFSCLENIDVSLERVLDLFSGIGSISLFVSSKAEHVTGVESVKESYVIALKNAEINNIENVSFFNMDVREYLNDNKEHFDTLIVDPPRSGVHPKVVKKINEMSVQKIIYMSCNPATFRDDLLGLENFNLESFEVFDMFPQTPHVESLALLKRKC